MVDVTGVLEAGLTVTTGARTVDRSCGHEHKRADQRGDHARRGADEPDPRVGAAKPATEADGRRPLHWWRVGSDLRRVPPEAVVGREPWRAGAFIVLVAGTMRRVFKRIHPECEVTEPLGPADIGSGSMASPGALRDEAEYSTSRPFDFPALGT